LLLYCELYVNKCNLKKTQIFIVETNTIICMEILKKCQLLCIEFPAVKEDIFYI
jgi:hypothetical protein